MEYILFIHNNTDTPTTKEQWDAFFTVANESGLFAGGSEIGKRFQIGAKPVTPVSNTITGYMRFESDDIDKIHKLLEHHPILIQGGTLELCETPKT